MVDARWMTHHCAWLIAVITGSNNNADNWLHAASAGSGDVLTNKVGVSGAVSL